MCIRDRDGIAYSMDMLRVMSNFDNSQIELANLLRPVLFIPESKTLEDLLTDFQEKHLQMAIVVDEYGGVSGLVTVEDIVEEIVGEIHDEFDRGAPRIKSIGKNQFHVDAGISIDDLKDQIGTLLSILLKKNSEVNSEENETSETNFETTAKAS